MAAVEIKVRPVTSELQPPRSQAGLAEGSVGDMIREFLAKNGVPTEEELKTIEHQIQVGVIYESPGKLLEHALVVWAVRKLVNNGSKALGLT